MSSLFAADASMIEKHKEILVKHIDIIADTLTSIDIILNTLVAEGVFHKDEPGELTNITQTKYQHNTNFVNRLLKKSEKGFFVFVEKLRNTNQNYLANLLDPGMCKYKF